MMEEQETKRPETQVEPELLYHYTTQEGLLGILKDKCIWATHLRYLNDTSEGEIVSRAVFEELSSRVNSFPLMQFLGVPPIERTVKTQCDDEEVISQGFAMSSWATSQNVFVASFSKEGNLLSQWRAYSGASGGYSIGFPPSYLGAAGTHFMQDRPGRFYSDSNPLTRCKYCDEKEESDLRNDIEALVTSYINEAVSTKQSPVKGAKEGFHTPAAIALKHFLPLGIRSAVTKDNAFREEAEWRLAFHLNRDNAHSDLEFRNGRSMLTPYFKVLLEWEGQQIDIKEIIVGPCPHPNEAVESVKMLLKKKGIDGVEVVPSKIPYRNW
jgi:Protein of unknown function (DUF2971)